MEIHQSMASYSTHHSLVVHQLRTRVEWLDTWQTSVPLLHALIVIQVSCTTCLQTLHMLISCSEIPDCYCFDSRVEYIHFWTEAA